MIEQIVISICGVLAIYLSQDPSPLRRRWACILGLCARPFWFIATYKAAQWGIFGISFLYTYSWARGFYVYWIAKRY